MLYYNTYSQLMVMVTLLQVCFLNRQQVERFIAQGVIAVGDVVAFSFANGANPGSAVLNVVKSTADKHCCGVALTAAAAAGDEINVVIGGVAEAKLMVK